jgi:superfamily II DNA or RNA helicase/HKD family nuclease
MKDKILDGLMVGYIDDQHSAHQGLEPQFIINQPSKALKVLSVYQSCLLECDSFQMAIAFLSDSGLQALYSTLLECEQKGVEGQIIISAYLNFTSPSAIKKLRTLSNIELRFNMSDAMHVKGTLFNYQDHKKFLVGSSNLTQEALSVNLEWNVLLHSTYQGQLFKEVTKDFNRLWERSEIVTDELLSDYEAKHKRFTQNQIIEEQHSTYGIGTIQPNTMQIKALAALKDARVQNIKRSLLISATGTGKTLLAAFDVAYHQPKRLLFVAHREQLLDQAIKSFKRVNHRTISYGKLSGTYKQVESDYLFATIQSLSQSEIMESFAQDHFDMIIIDEAHRVGGPTYQKLMAYFKPNFMLGMSATPERMDGFNVYEAFNYHVAYEIRLNDALKENMLVPFHYYGIKDLLINGKLIDDHTDMKHLVSEDRVNHLIRQINLYEVRDIKRKGLIFVSRVQEAIELNRLFNEFGRIYNLKSEVVSGSDDTLKKEALIKQLQSDQIGTINYLFTVDVLNEGVDIPNLNQIIMLRPTQSAIIFVQQLGRGLRKAMFKDYVLVLDFIGNYTNNFHIPIALSSDRTYQKENLRRFIHEGTKIIYGPSTINLERVVKDRIFESLDKVRFNHKKFLLSQYELLTQRLNRIPTLMDFEREQAMDPTLFFSNKDYQSYHFFLQKEKIVHFDLSERQWKSIKFLSRFVGYGKRPHEALTLEICINSSIGSVETTLVERLKTYGLLLRSHELSNIKNVLTNTWLTGTGRHTFQGVSILNPQSDQFELSEHFKDDLKHPLFKKLVIEIIDYALYRYEHVYHIDNDKTGFALYQTYSTKDVMQIAGWDEMVIEQNVGGYFIHHESKTLPIFVNYHKEDHIQSSIQYHDHFTSKEAMVWVSKSNRRLSSNEIQSIIKNFPEYRVMLFVRKKASDDKHFLYLGEVSLVDQPQEIVLKDGKSKAVEFMLNLNHPLRDDIYDYIVNK